MLRIVARRLLAKVKRKLKAYTRGHIFIFFFFLKFTRKMQFFFFFFSSDWKEIFCKNKHSGFIKKNSLFFVQVIFVNSKTDKVLLVLKKFRQIKSFGGKKLIFYKIRGYILQISLCGLEPTRRHCHSKSLHRKIRYLRVIHGKLYLCSTPSRASLVTLLKGSFLTRRSKMGLNVWILDKMTPSAPRRLSCGDANWEKASLLAIWKD